MYLTIVLIFIFTLHYWKSITTTVIIIIPNQDLLSKYDQPNNRPTYGRQDITKIWVKFINFATYSRIWNASLMRYTYKQIKVRIHFINILWNVSTYKLLQCDRINLLISDIWNRFCFIWKSGGRRISVYCRKQCSLVVLRQSYGRGSYYDSQRCVHFIGY